MIDYAMFGMMAFSVGMAIAGVWSTTRFWSKFVDDLIERNSKQSREMIDQHHKQGMKQIDTFYSSMDKMHDAWEDRVRMVFGLEPRKRAELVEIKPDTDSRKPEGT